jgi:hypothetical protein
MIGSKKTAAQLNREIDKVLRKPLSRALRPNVRALNVDLARTDEHGVHFETGVPVTFPFLRNTEKSPRVGSSYGQDIEPHGRYLLHNTDPDRSPPSRWETGTVTFKFPLVIPLTGDSGSIYGPAGWKARLRDATGRRGAALSRFLAQRFDGIVTVDAYGTSEIVDLARFRK